MISLSADIILKLKEVDDIWCYNDGIDLHGYLCFRNQRYDEMAKWWHDDKTCSAEQVEPASSKAADIKPLAIADTPEHCNSRHFYKKQICN